MFFYTCIKEIYLHSIFHKFIYQNFKYFYQQVHTGKEKYYTQYSNVIKLSTADNWQFL